MMLVMGGHHHSIDGVGGRMTPARPLAEDAPVPFYLASNRRLARNVRAGDAILMRDLEFDDASPLVQLRRRQDASSSRSCARLFAAAWFVTLGGIKRGPSRSTSHRGSDRP